MTERRRGLAARVGVAALNLIAPGLGLLRLGQVRQSLGFYGLYLVAFLIFVGALVVMPDISFPVYAAALTALLFISLATFGISTWLTLKGSKFTLKHRPLWSRWYSVLGAALIVFAVNWVLTDIWQGQYRNFYLPSEGMEPTLMKGDRLVAAMNMPTNLRRGDLVLVKSENQSIYIKRLAGLPGDKIALRNGVVFINGEAARQIPKRRRSVSYPYLSANVAALFEEQFPGEHLPHLIQDLGPSPLDDFPEVVVGPQRVFVLGDNRDNSADSRVEAWMGGLEQVPLENVVGRALFMHWPPDKMGRSLRPREH